MTRHCLRHGFFAVVLLAFSWGGPADAASSALYRARVAVADEGAEARADGFRAALAQVLVKLAGQRQVLARPDIEPWLEGAADLVEEYGYQRRPRDVPEPDEDSSGEPLADASAGAPQVVEDLELIVRFSAPTLDAELRRLELPRWLGERRPLLLWVLAAEPRREEIAALARGVLEERGIPVLEPLWDLQDIQAMEDTAQVDAARLADASARYPAEYWVLLEPRIGPDSIQGRWLLGGGEPASGRLAEAQLSVWVATAMHAAVDLLGSREAHVPGGQLESGVLEIEGVGDYSDYRAVASALEAMGVVHGLQVRAMAAGRVTFAVQVEGAAEALWRALAEHPGFAEIADMAVPTEKHRRYLWRGATPDGAH